MSTESLSQHTLLIGCGALGQLLAQKLVEDGPLDILTRSYNREGFIKTLIKKAPSENTCRHYVRDIGNSRFEFPVNQYQRIIFNPAVSVDRRLTHADKKIHFKGTRNFLNQCQKHRFTGQLVMIGCAQALAQLPCPKGSEAISESSLTSLSPAFPSSQWQQFCLFDEYRSKTQQAQPFIFCGLLYQRDNYPEPKSLNGLTVTTKNPRTWMNLIHINDASQILLYIIRTKGKGNYILTDGNPILRGDYYRLLTGHFGKKVIRFVPSQERPPITSKVRSQRIDEIPFELKYPEFVP